MGVKDPPVEFEIRFTRFTNQYWATNKPLKVDTSGKVIFNEQNSLCNQAEMLVRLPAESI